MSCPKFRLVWGQTFFSTKCAAEICSSRTMTFSSEVEDTFWPPARKEVLKSSDFVGVLFCVYFPPLDFFFFFLVAFAVFFLPLEKKLGQGREHIAIFPSVSSLVGKSSNYANERKQGNGVFHGRFRQLTLEFLSRKLLCSVVLTLEWLGKPSSDWDFLLCVRREGNKQLWDWTFFLKGGRLSNFFSPPFTPLEVCIRDNGSKPAQPSGRTPDCPRTGRLGDRPGGAFQRRHEPQEHHCAPVGAHEDEEASWLLLQTPRTKVPFQTSKPALSPLGPLPRNLAGSRQGLSCVGGPGPAVVRDWYRRFTPQPVHLLHSHQDNLKCRMQKIFFSPPPHRVCLHTERDVHFFSAWAECFAET